MTYKHMPEPCSAPDGWHVAEEQIRAASISNASQERLERFAEQVPQTEDEIREQLKNRINDNQPKRSRVHEYIAALDGEEVDEDADDGGGIPE